MKVDETYLTVVNVNPVIHGVVFERNAKAECDSSTQTWKAENGETWSQFNGICVSSCSCVGHGTGYFDVDNIMVNNSYYEKEIYYHPYKPPSFTFSDDGCQYQRECSDGRKLVGFLSVDGSPYWNVTSSTCSGKTWTVKDGFEEIQTDFLITTCVNFDSRGIPPPPGVEL